MARMNGARGGGREKKAQNRTSTTPPKTPPTGEGVDRRGITEKKKNVRSGLFGTLVKNAPPNVQGSQKKKSWRITSHFTHSVELIAAPGAGEGYEPKKTGTDHERICGTERKKEKRTVKAGNTGTNAPPKKVFSSRERTVNGNPFAGGGSTGIDE